MSISETKVEGWNRPPVIEPEGEGELLELAMGPHHPSTHGVFRMDLALDGERVIRLKPVFGYLHRNHEQLGERQSYLSSMPYTDRLDYICSLTNNWAYALAVEKLVGQARSGARRVSSGDPGGADAGAEPCLVYRLFAAGDGRERHAADVCVSRAGKDSGPV